MVLFQKQRTLLFVVFTPTYTHFGRFSEEGSEFDSAALAPIFDRLKDPRNAKIIKTYKNPFADLFPAWRSRVGLKITRTNACDACNICGRNCPVGAIENGNISRRCIRCLRCATVCPKKALQIKQKVILKLYLKQKKRCGTVIYL